LPIKFAGRFESQSQNKEEVRKVAVNGRDVAQKLALNGTQLTSVARVVNNLSKVAGEPNFPVAVMIVGVSGAATELRCVLGELDKMEAALRQPETG
jgi:hypothetical protein